MERTKKKVRVEESEGERGMEGGLTDLEGRRNEQSEGGKEKGEEDRGSLRGSIGRFKDDHALSAAHHTTLLTNPPSSTSPMGNATR